jgi:hypothetical protein
MRIGELLARTLGDYVRALRLGQIRIYADFIIMARPYQVARCEFSFSTCVAGRRTCTRLAAPSLEETKENLFRGPAEIVIGKTGTPADPFDFLVRLYNAQKARLGWEMYFGQFYL